MTAPEQGKNTPTCRRQSTHDDWIVLSASLLTTALMIFVVLIS